MLSMLLRGGGLTALLLSTSALAATERPTYRFDRQWLIEHAQELAKSDYVPQRIAPDNPLSKLDYDRYRSIEFRRGASIWTGEGRNFRVDLLPPGFIFNVPVKINLVVGGVSRRVLYTTDVFKYGLDTGALKNVEAAGYSGFRVAATINRPDVFDEFLVFQGASYFRAVGRDERYGLSARGLAINTAKPGGEEFPAFTEFWIERPPQNASHIVIDALLESPSITGAYTFTVDPGDATTVGVEAVLFPRRDLASFGIAPLTSMFLFDSTNRVRFDDFRPAVHDSDGLAIATGTGEHVWRPLANPTALQVSSFSGGTVRGFGLMQRTRRFDDFEDSEARYELRPSAWIEPRGDWGEGHVELVEIPSDKEIYDNIVAFWQPSEPLRAGGRYEFAYRISWSDAQPEPAAGARVVATRAGLDTQVGAKPGVRTFVVDYAADKIPDDLTVGVTTSAGTILDARGMKVEATGLYRAHFKFDPRGTDLAELRMVLTSNGKPWGETWLYRWTR